MKLESSEFVKAAYLLLLGRTVDAQGEAYYTSRLNGGVQKAQIIQELGCSVEASERGVDIKALMREVGAINGFYKSIFWRLSKGRGRGELQN
jgi:hypothetical protein